MQHLIKLNDRLNELRDQLIEQPHKACAVVTEIKSIEEKLLRMKIYGVLGFNSILQSPN